MIKRIGQGMQRFTIKAKTLVKNAMITIDNLDINPNENYVDLLPNKTKTFYLPKHISIKNLKDKIKIVSLIDTYQP